MLGTLGSILFSCIALYVINSLVKFWSALRSIGHLSGYRVAFSQHSLVSLLGKIRGITPGGNHFFEDKHDTFQEWDINSVVSAFPEPLITLTVADADAIKEMTSSRARFPKPVFQYKVLTFFGRNIVASEGEEWKKYRKISAPAFSDRNNKLVWDETILIVNSLFNDVWKDKDIISLDHCVDITLPIALAVISAAGFGKRSSWFDDDEIPNGHSMTFKQSLHIASTDIFFKFFFSGTILRYGTARMRNVQIAFDELSLYISEMIKERQLSEKVERYDLFSSLLEANSDDGEEVRLTESELRGNIFIYLIAGHETTAHTLCFTFALLAFHEDEQEKLYQHIKSILLNGQNPSYEDMPRLTYSMAVFYETLRLFPPVVNIPKVAGEDTVLTVGNVHGEKRSFPIAKGTRVAINTPGLHFNPRYWDDPTSFKPSRFLKSDWNRDAFLPFSAGARACLGRRFFETEGIAVLTMLVSRYKISIKQEPQFAGETIEQCKERVFRTSNMLTLTPVRVPLTFTRRT
ncbi:Cytochrome P450 monooxygenase 124 [Psilocybe cubensis]|uniref:Cytochrome P450 monooxygenase 124 n=2 Tax=Psilocybe cubensis TaxID=181762 RepID=A0ACB8HC45_PSICU|nr:Cytochrome P450 monooxygenase 124 [Psilocybe cubensis]KAH9485051.1 Cytochrome P450 monooxygenase 124 [Psilocybe cubensis]